MDDLTNGIHTSLPAYVAHNIHYLLVVGPFILAIDSLVKLKVGDISINVFSIKTYTLTDSF